MATSVPFDAQSLVNDITQTATVDETQGFVQGVDQAVIEAALESYQQQIEDYINNQTPDATVGEVLGIQRVIVQEYQQLAAGLPYDLIARTQNYSTLPDSLRHRFRYTLGTEFFGREASRLITFEQLLAELAGKKHALSFRPATQADEDLINSFIPEPDPDTGDIDPNQLPNSLPGYLIDLVAEFTQNDDVIHSAPAGAMGSELHESLALWSPAFGWDEIVNHPTAGEYRAIGLDLQGANPEEAARLQAEVEATFSILDEGNISELSNLTKEDVVGDLLYSVIYSYFYLNDIQAQIQARENGMINYRLPSFGIFTTISQTSYFFGVPRNVQSLGLGMDVDRLAIQNVEKENDQLKAVNFIKAMGVQSSAMEHVVPEQMLSTEDSVAQGVSAIKAIALASSEGQKIWSIDRTNVSDALDSIDLGFSIENEIRNAAFSGKEVTAHEQFINFAGGSNAGYLLVDPETGSGAYLIASGTSGSEVRTSIGNLVDILGKGVSVLEEFFDRIGDSGGRSLFNSLGKVFTGLGSFLTILDFRSCSIASIIAVALLTTMYTLLLAFLLSGLIFLAQFIILAIAGLVLSKFFSDFKSRFCTLN